MGVKLVSLLHEEISPSHCDLWEYGCLYWNQGWFVAWLSVINTFLFPVAWLMVNVSPNSQDLGIELISGMSLEIQYDSQLTQEEIESQMG